MPCHAPGARHLLRVSHRHLKFNTHKIKFPKCPPHPPTSACPPSATEVPRICTWPSHTGDFFQRPVLPVWVSHLRPRPKLPPLPGIFLLLPCTWPPPPRASGAGLHTICSDELSWSPTRPQAKLDAPSRAPMAQVTLQTGALTVLYRGTCWIAHLPSLDH